MFFYQFLVSYKSKWLGIYINVFYGMNALEIFKK